MTLTDAIRLMRFRFGNRTDPEFEELLKLELQAAQDTLEGLSFLPHFLVQEELSAATIVRDERVPLPDNFLKEYQAEASNLWLVLEGVRKEIKKLSPKNFYKLFPSETSYDRPEAYILTGRYLRLRPVPDQRYSLLLLCYQKAVPVATVAENAWLKNEPELLLSVAGATMASFLEDEKREIIFSRKAGAELEKMRQSIVERGEAGKDAQMGGEEA